MAEITLPLEAIRALMQDCPCCDGTRGDCDEKNKEAAAAFPALAPTLAEVQKEQREALAAWRERTALR